MTRNVLSLRNKREKETKEKKYQVHKLYIRDSLSLRASFNIREMSVPLLSSQPSWDLSVYLPPNIDPDEASHLISGDALLCSFKLGPSLLAHRTESEPFYPGAKDNEAMSLMDGGCTTSISGNEPDKNDIGKYICRHSEVKPVEPSKIQRKN